MLVNFYVENVSCEFHGRAALDHGVPTTHFANLGESKTRTLEVTTNGDHWTSKKSLTLTTFHETFPDHSFFQTYLVFSMG